MPAEDLAAGLGDERDALDAHAPRARIAAGLQRDEHAGSEHRLAAGHDPRLLVGRDPEAVARVVRVLEPLAHECVEVAGDDARRERGQPALERIAAARVRRAHLRGHVADRDGHAGVAVVAGQARHEVDDRQVAVAQDARAGRATDLPAALAAREVAQQREALAGRLSIALCTVPHASSSVAPLRSAPRAAA